MSCKGSNGRMNKKTEDFSRVDVTDVHLFSERVLDIWERNHNIHWDHVKTTIKSMELLPTQDASHYEDYYVDE